MGDYYEVSHMKFLLVPTTIIYPWFIPTICTRIWYVQLHPSKSLHISSRPHIYNRTCPVSKISTVVPTSPSSLFHYWFPGLYIHVTTADIQYGTSHPEKTKTQTTLTPTPLSIIDLVTLQIIIKLPEDAPNTLLKTVSGSLHHALKSFWIPHIQ